MKVYQITLPDEFAAFVDRMIAEKKWDDLDSRFLAAVVRLQDEDEADEARTPEEVEALRKKLQVGLDQLDRGERVDGPEFMAKLQERLREKAHAPQSSS
jgi:hypothetical protein